jgi:predicted  nucleic acid-binding Zn ribbon protein|tara:strand:+ start:559 stop:876 length:318 start_codon:yes stop_codon:yes gene_type:complete
MNLPPNYNARLLSDQSGAPSTYATQQALQQEQSKAAVNANTTAAQNASMIMDQTREVMADIDTRSAQENAYVRAVVTAKAIQANSGLPMTNVGTDLVGTMRQLGY